MKIISVPKNEEAERLLEVDQCPSDQLDEVVLSQDQFDKLWSVGLFNQVNRICGSLIDDYEDESISSVEAIEAVLLFIQTTQWSDDIVEYTKSIESLLVKAKEYNTSVHFYF